MNLASTALLALAMSADAFAAAIGKGAALHRPRFGEALRTGMIFGAIEGITPIAGWMLGLAAARHVAALDHWIAFVLLGGLGLHMIHASRAPADDTVARRSGHSFMVLVATGLGTSIDAMAVGVGLALIGENIVPIAAAIGLATTVMVTLGVMLGRILGTVAGKRAEMMGGAILILIGTTILVDHLLAGPP
jgi:manganese efflux pump family protein